MSKPKRPVLAICYDFDGTLSPGNMQEYDFIPKLNITNSNFWKEVRKRAKEQKGDEILAYMRIMIEHANADPSKNIKIDKKAFENYAKKVELFEGVMEWFERINGYGKQKGLNIKHFIISSGIREMIEGTVIAKKFERIYASSFMYDQHGVATWPALAINYTTKTQFLFRINKGYLDEWDNKEINKYTPKEDRPIPFERMIYIGDGTTDVPCMKLVKDQGGHSIAVYKPNSSTEHAKKLREVGRVNFVSPADYSEDKDIDKQVKAIIDKVSADCEIKKLK